MTRISYRYQMAKPKKVVPEIIERLKNVKPENVCEVVKEFQEECDHAKGKLVAYVGLAERKFFYACDRCGKLSMRKSRAVL